MQGARASWAGRLRVAGQGGRGPPPCTGRGTRAGITGRGARPAQQPSRGAGPCRCLCSAPPHCTCSPDLPSAGIACPTGRGAQKLRQGAACPRSRGGPTPRPPPRTWAAPGNRPARESLGRRTRRHSPSGMHVREGGGVRCLLPLPGCAPWLRSLRVTWPLAPRNASCCQAENPPYPLPARCSALCGVLCGVYTRPTG